MKLEAAIEQLLASHMPRIRFNNGLSRNMEQSLRSYKEIPLIITRSVECLASLDYLFNFTEVTGLHYSALYQILTHSHEDWLLEVPVLPRSRGAGPVLFTRKPRLPLHRFSAAWTIARRIDLLTGRGTIRLHQTAAAELRRITGSPRKGSDS